MIVYTVKYATKTEIGSKPTAAGLCKLRPTLIRRALAAIK